MGRGEEDENMQQYSYKNFHHVPVAVIYCLDPRFRKQHERFIAEELWFDDFDQYVFPGGPKVLADEATREIFLGAIEKVSVGLHEVKELVLIAHRDCGAYGGSVAFPGPVEEKATQVEDLKLARGILNEKFPKIKVSMFYAEITGDNIEFFPVPVNWSKTVQLNISPLDPLLAAPWWIFFILVFYRKIRYNIKILYVKN